MVEQVRRRAKKPRRLGWVVGRGVGDVVTDDARLGGVVVGDEVRMERAAARTKAGGRGRWSKKI